MPPSLLGNEKSRYKNNCAPLIWALLGMLSRPNLRRVRTAPKFPYQPTSRLLKPPKFVLGWLLAINVSLPTLIWTEVPRVAVSPAGWTTAIGEVGSSASSCAAAAAGTANWASSMAKTRITGPSKRRGAWAPKRLCCCIVNLLSIYEQEKTSLAFPRQAGAQTASQSVTANEPQIRLWPHSVGHINDGASTSQLRQGVVQIRFLAEVVDGRHVKYVRTIAKPQLQPGELDAGRGGIERSAREAAVPCCRYSRH